MDRNRFLNYFINTSFNCCNAITYFLYPIFLMGIGMSGSRIGILLMVYTLTALFASFTVGIFEDRFGARANTACGLALTCLFYLGLIVCRSFPSLLLLFFLGGLGGNIIRVTMNALFFKSHDSRRQGREIGLYNFFPQFFMGCGIITGSLLLSWSDFRVIFGVSLLLSLTLVGFALSFRPLSVSVEPLSRYLRDLATRRVFLFVIALVLFCLHWGAEITCYSPFLKDNLGIGTASAGLFMGLPIIFLACCSYYFGWRRDRGESSIRLAILAIALSGTGLILFSATRTPLISFLFRLVHEAGDAAFTVFSYIGIARLFPRQRVGGTSGSMIVVMIGAQSAGALLFSWMGGAFGYAAPYIVAGSCSLASIPLILYSQRHYRFEPLPRE